MRGADPGKNRAAFEAAQKDVLGGSNITNFATGNASGGVGFGYGSGAGDPFTYRDPRTGERYSVENNKRDIEWARRMAEATRDGGSNVSELQSQIAGIRRGALSARTRGFLDYASSKTGLSVEVGSGGQPGSGPNRTGSHRHDFGGAADFKLFEMVDGKKRYLDMRNPADAARMEEFTAHTVAAGATGVGAGLGYMGPNSIHVGGGTRATWGGASWISRASQRGLEMSRSIVDDSLKRKTAEPPKGFVKAEVDFSNMPIGKFKSGDDLGKFKLIKLNAASQGAKDMEGMLAPGDLSYTPAVP